MKKLINNPEMVPKETLEGFVEAYGDLYELVEGVNGIKWKEGRNGVAVIIGGNVTCLFEKFFANRQNI